MALCSHTSSISSLQGLTGSSIICLPDGSVSLMTGTTDMGNGSETAMVQVCAEKLGMDLCDVRHADLDTSTSPYNIGSYSSGQMFLTGNAVAMACEEVIRKAKVELAKLYNVPVEQVLWRDKMFHIVYPGKRMTFKEAILDISRGCLNMFIMGSAVAHLEDAPEPFALCWAKVAYYKKENAIKLKHIIESVDVGRVMNPLIVKGQLEGEIQMGVGYALMEDLEIDPITKKYVSADLLNYRNPLILDMPEVHLFVADSFEPRSANGTKSVGELGLIPVAPAITDAVIRASGKRSLSCRSAASSTSRTTAMTTSLRRALTMMILARYEYYRPSTVEEAVSMLKRENTIIAGGSDVMPQLKTATIAPEALIDLSKISEMHTVEETDDGIYIGAMVTLSHLAKMS